MNDDEALSKMSTGKLIWAVSLFLRCHDTVFHQEQPSGTSEREGCQQNQRDDAQARFVLPPVYCVWKDDFLMQNCEGGININYLISSSNYKTLYFTSYLIFPPFLLLFCT